MSTPSVMNPVLDGYDRGFPLEAAGLRVSDVAAQGWQLHEHFETPIAVLRDDHVGHNAELMRQWCARHSAQLWPHAKTVMSPQLIQRQLDSGSRGMTAATFPQARLLLDWGVPGVLIANQIVSPRAAQHLAHHVARSGQELICYVDSTHGAEVLDAAAREAGTVIDVLIELGAPGGRTGVRTTEEAIALRHRVDALPGLRLIGVSSYEGSFGGDRSPLVNERIREYLTGLASLLDRLHSDAALQTEEPVLSGGGSMHFDLVAEAAAQLGFPHRVILRSGCYLLHDTGLFENATPLRERDGEPGLRAALSVWGTVLSRPEPGRAYLDIGRRDAGFDQGLPRPLRRRNHRTGDITPLDQARTLQLNDQHLHLELPPATDLAIGDRVEFGISHPCTTMDKWRTIPLINASGSVVGAVNTRF